MQGPCLFFSALLCWTLWGRASGQEAFREILKWSQHLTDKEKAQITADPAGITEDQLRKVAKGFMKDIPTDPAKAEKENAKVRKILRDTIMKDMTSEPKDKSGTPDFVKSDAEFEKSFEEHRKMLKKVTGKERVQDLNDFDKEKMNDAYNQMSEEEKDAFFGGARMDSDKFAKDQMRKAKMYKTSGQSHSEL